MDLDYQDEQTAIKYLEFLNSENGQIQQEVLLKAILSRLPKNKNLAVLDAACGPGWLSGELQKHFAHVKACDASEFFVKFAAAQYPKVEFKVTPFDHPLPYKEHSFDCVILNMAGPDLENLTAAFKNLATVLKPGGSLLATIPNPKYTYPAAEWKRSLVDVLLLGKPRLKIKTPPLSGTRIVREFGKDVKINSFYHGLESYISAAAAAGLKLKEKLDITSQTDSPKFDLLYQLYRYPLLLMLEFRKND